MRPNSALRLAGGRPAPICGSVAGWHRDCQWQRRRQRRPRGACASLPGPPGPRAVGRRRVTRLRVQPQVQVEVASGPKTAPGAVGRALPQPTSQADAKLMFKLHASALLNARRPEFPARTSRRAPARPMGLPQHRRKSVLGNLCQRCIGSDQSRTQCGRSGEREPL